MQSSISEGPDIRLGLRLLFTVILIAPLVSVHNLVAWDSAVIDTRMERNMIEPSYAPGNVIYKDLYYVPTKTGRIEYPHGLSSDIDMRTPAAGSALPEGTMNGDTSRPIDPHPFPSGSQ